MSTGRPTLKQIATELGLGVTTVSRALSDAGDISETTKDKVRQTAARLGYRRNPAGVNLRTGRTGNLSFVLNPHDELVGYGSSLLHGLSEGLQGSDHSLTVIPDFLSGDPVKPVARLISSGATDGVIFSQTRPQDARARLLLEHGLPFATHGRTELASAHPSYDFDNQAFVEQAVERLIARGSRRIALIGPPRMFLYAHHMDIGLRRALAVGHAEDASPQDLNLTSPDAALAHWAASTRADGIICGGERAALAVARGLDHAARSVPVAAKHTSAMLPLAQPDMMLCLEDLAETGRRLAQLILARLDGADETGLQHIQSPRWTQG